MREDDRRVLAVVAREERGQSGVAAESDSGEQGERSCGASEQTGGTVRQIGKGGEGEPCHQEAAGRVEAADSRVNERNLECLLVGNRTKRNTLKVLKTLLDARQSFFVFLVDGSRLCFDLHSKKDSWNSTFRISASRARMRRFFMRIRCAQSNLFTSTTGPQLQ